MNCWLKLKNEICRLHDSSQFLLFLERFISYAEYEMLVNNLSYSKFSQNFKIQNGESKMADEYHYL